VFQPKQWAEKEAGKTIENRTQPELVPNQASKSNIVRGARMTFGRGRQRRPRPPSRETARQGAPPPAELYCAVRVGRGGERRHDSRRGRRHLADVGMTARLILKRASASRPDGQWSDEDDDVLADGKGVGRIYEDDPCALPGGPEARSTVENIADASTKR
jgi:hypothetical protein